jgi:hypothetical protein
MHVYRKQREGTEYLYTVGYYIPESGIAGRLPQFVPLEDTSNEAEARELVNYLNGGSGEPFRYSRKT